MSFAVPRHVSINDFAERLWGEEGPLPPAETILQLARDVAQQMPERMLVAFSWLPALDYEICRLYFVEGLSQEGVSTLVGIGQPEVSGRLHSCVKLLPFLLRRPTTNPIQVRSDFSELLPRRLLEPAHALYFSVAASRAATLVRVSEGTMRNLRKDVEMHLGKLAALPGRGPYDHTALVGLGLIDPAGTVLADDEVTRRRELASRYFGDFRRAASVSARFVRVSRKNEAVRAQALIEWGSITGPPVRKTGSGKQTEQMRTKSSREPSPIRKDRPG